MPTRFVRNPHAVRDTGIFLIGLAAGAAAGAIIGGPTFLPLCIGGILGGAVAWFPLVVTYRRSQRRYRV
jgi:hypothetical protein